MNRLSSAARRLLLAVLTCLWLAPAAAQQADIEINTPAIGKLKSSMQARFDRMEKYFSAGAVGLTSDGLVTVRDAAAVPLPERAQINALVAEENQDRRALYREIAVANGHPEWEDEVQKTFAERWAAKARGGWWVQGADGWSQK